jgi:hypothetical protein
MIVNHRSETINTFKNHARSLYSYFSSVHAFRSKPNRRKVKRGREKIWLIVYCNLKHYQRALRLGLCTINVLQIYYNHLYTYLNNGGTLLRCVRHTHEIPAAENAFENIPLGTGRCNNEHKSTGNNTQADTIVKTKLSISLELPAVAAQCT